MNSEKQIDEMACEKCLHYEGCLKRFREAKKNGQYELIDEHEYFAHADDCDMFITGYRKASEVAAEIFAEINKIIEKHYNKHIFGDNDLDDLEHEAIINFSDDVTNDIDDLKEKYTEGENDNA